MIKILTTLAALFVFQSISFSQISYQDLSNYLEMDKDEITLSLKNLDPNWKYSQPKLNEKTEIWINSGTTITIKNFNNKEYIKLEYYTKDSNKYKEIIRQIGASFEYNEAIIKETPKVIYNFWHSKLKTAVGHIICSETDTVCFLQLDLMKIKAFKQSDYN